MPHHHLMASITEVIEYQVQSIWIVESATKHTDVDPSGLCTERRKNMKGLVCLAEGLAAIHMVARELLRRHSG
jgi:hypothetical protein